MVYSSLSEHYTLDIEKSPSVYKYPLEPKGKQFVKTL